MSKTVPFQTIQFSIKTWFSSIKPIDRTLSGTTTPGQSGSDSNNGVLRIPQSSGFTGTSPSDYLLSYPGHSLGGSYPLSRGSRCILQIQPNGQLIIIIMSCRKHGYPWPSLATSPNHSPPLVGLQGYIPYPHIAAVCMFDLVVLLLLGHMWGVHRSTSLMRSSLLLQQCSARLVRLAWIVFVMRGRWPYSWCLMGCCCQTCSILLATFLCNCRPAFLQPFG